MPSLLDLIVQRQNATDRLAADPSAAREPAPLPRLDDTTPVQKKVSDQQLMDEAAPTPVTSFVAGVESTKASLKNAIAGAAQAVGAMDVNRSMRKSAEANEAEAARLGQAAGAPQSLRDVDGVGSFASYLGNSVARNAPQLGVMAAGAALSGGRLLGAAAPSAAMNFGDVYGEGIGEVDALEKTGRIDAARAEQLRDQVLLKSGLATPILAALDTIGFGSIIGKNLLAKEVAKSLPAHIRGAILKEGATETAQEYVGMVANKLALEKPDAFGLTEADLWRLADAGVQGAAAGGAFAPLGHASALPGRALDAAVDAGAAGLAYARNRLAPPEAPAAGAPEPAPEGPGPSAGTRFGEALARGIDSNFADLGKQAVEMAKGIPGVGEAVQQAQDFAAGVGTSQRVQGGAESAKAAWDQAEQAYNTAAPEVKQKAREAADAAKAAWEQTRDTVHETVRRAREETPEFFAEAVNAAKRAYQRARGAEAPGQTYGGTASPAQSKAAYAQLRDLSREWSPKDRKQSATNSADEPVIYGVLRGMIGPKIATDDEVRVLARRFMPLVTDTRRMAAEFGRPEVQKAINEWTGGYSALEVAGYIFAALRAQNEPAPGQAQIAGMAPPARVAEDVGGADAQAEAAEQDDLSVDPDAERAFEADQGMRVREGAEVDRNQMESALAEDQDLPSDPGLRSRERFKQSLAFNDPKVEAERAAHTRAAWEGSGVNVETDKVKPYTDKDGKLRFTTPARSADKRAESKEKYGSNAAVLLTRRYVDPDTGQVLHENTEPRWVNMMNIAKAAQADREFDSESVAEREKFDRDFAAGVGELFKGWSETEKVGDRILRVEYSFQPAKGRTQGKERAADPVDMTTWLRDNTKIGAQVKRDQYNKPIYNAKGQPEKEARTLKQATEERRANTATSFNQRTQQYLDRMLSIDAAASPAARERKETAYAKALGRAAVEQLYRVLPQGEAPSTQYKDRITGAQDEVPGGPITFTHETQSEVGPLRAFAEDTRSEIEAGSASPYLDRAWDVLLDPEMPAVVRSYIAVRFAQAGEQNDMGALTGNEVPGTKSEALRTERDALLAAPNEERGTQDYVLRAQNYAQGVLNLVAEHDAGGRGLVSVRLLPTHVRESAQESMLDSLDQIVEKRLTPRGEQETSVDNPDFNDENKAEEEAPYNAPLKPTAQNRAAMRAEAERSKSQKADRTEGGIVKTRGGYVRRNPGKSPEESSVVRERREAAIAANTPPPGTLGIDGRGIKPVPPNNLDTLDPRAETNDRYATPGVVTGDRKRATDGSSLVVMQTPREDVEARIARATKEVERFKVSIPSYAGVTARRLDAVMSAVVAAATRGEYSFKEALSFISQLESLGMTTKELNFALLPLVPVPIKVAQQAHKIVRELTGGAVDTSIGPFLSKIGRSSDATRAGLTGVNYVVTDAATGELRMGIDLATVLAGLYDDPSEKLLRTAHHEVMHSVLDRLADRFGLEAINPLYAAAQQPHIRDAVLAARPELDRPYFANNPEEMLVEAYGMWATGKLKINAVSKLHGFFNRVKFLFHMIMGRLSQDELLVEAFNAVKSGEGAKLAQPSAERVFELFEEKQKAGVLNYDGAVGDRTEGAAEGEGPAKKAIAAATAAAASVFDSATNSAKSSIRAAAAELQKRLGNDWQAASKEDAAQRGKADPPPSGTADGFVTQQVGPVTLRYDPAVEFPVYHFTTAEAADAIAREGYDFSKPPVHKLYSGKSYSTVPGERAASNAAYFTTDAARWQFKYDRVAEGTGTDDSNEFDYKAQQWITRPKGLRISQLNAVVGYIQRDANILSLHSLAEARKWGDNITEAAAKARAEGYDGVNIRNTDSGWPADRYRDFSHAGGNNDYIIFNKDAVRPEHGNVKFARAGFGPDLDLTTPQGRALAIAAIRAIAGKVGIKFVAHDAAAGTYDPVGHVVTLAANHRGALGTALHEALHAVFRAISPEDKRRLYNALDQGQVKRRLAALLAGSPEAIEAMKNDPEERAAYAFQFWKLGLLKLGPETGTWFDKLVSLIEQTWEYLTGRPGADEIFNRVAGGFYAAGEDAAARAVLAQERTRALPRQVLAHAVRGVEKVYDKFLTAVDDRLRDSGSSELTDLARELYVQTGEEAGRPGLAQAIPNRTKRFLNEFSKILGPDANHAMEALRSIAEERPARTNVAARIVPEMRKFLNKLHAYQVQAGRDLGFVQGYLPMQWSGDKIAADLEGFTEMLTKYQPEIDALNKDLGTKLSPASIATMMSKRNLSSAIPTGDVFDDRTGVPTAHHAEERVFKFIRNADRAPWVEDDLVASTSQYIKQAVRSAEYVRRFGQNSEALNAKLDAARRSGATPEQIQLVHDSIDNIYGAKYKRMDPSLRRVLGAVQTYQNFRVLGLAVFSSFIDPLVLGVRSGDMNETWGAYKYAIKNLFKKHQGELQELGETIGALESEGVMDAIADMYGGFEVEGDLRKANDLLFTYNGLNGLTRALRVYATGAAVRFIQKHAAGGRHLKELGLEASDVHTMPDGRLAVLGRDFASLGLDAAAAGKAALKVQDAINRFVRESVLHPNAQERPNWGSDPLWGLVFHLKQYVFSFHKVVSKKVTHELAEGNPSVLLQAAPFIPIMAASTYMKELIQFAGDVPADRDFMYYLTKGFSRSGFMGPSALGHDFLSDLSQGHSGVGAVGGPTVDQALEALEVVGSQNHVDAFGKFVEEALPGSSVFKRWND